MRVEGTCGRRTAEILPDSSEPETETGCKMRAGISAGDCSWDYECKFVVFTFIKGMTLAPICVGQLYVIKTLF